MACPQGLEGAAEAVVYMNAYHDHRNYIKDSINRAAESIDNCLIKVFNRMGYTVRNKEGIEVKDEKNKDDRASVNHVPRRKPCAGSRLLHLVVDAAS